MDEYTEKRQEIEIAADLLEDMNDHEKAAEVREWANDGTGEDNVIERDWITESGLRAVVLMCSRIGHRCGYVAVPASHVLFGISYSSPLEVVPQAVIDFMDHTEIGERGVIPVFFAMVTGDINHPTLKLVFDVHGSLTYSNNSICGYPVADSEDWWFGFDCGQAGDGNINQPQLGGIVRSTEYVVCQCESLAKQIIRLFGPSEPLITKDD